jgi:hypothetical protein
MSGFHSQLDHDAICPEISPVHCETAEDNGDPIPPHEHRQSVLFGTFNTGIIYTFDANWQAGASIPLQYRSISIDYTHLGTDDPYVPPYAGIHHRNETLVGLGDASIFGQRLWYKDHWTFALSSGTSIPIGRTEENPYLLGEQGKEHQHFQMGTGTFVPSLELLTFRRQNDYGWIGKVRGEFSLYENEYNYKTGSALRWETGVWKAINPKVLLLGQIKGNHEQSDTWMGLTAPFSGRHALSAEMLFTGKIRSDWELLLRIEQLMYVQNFESEIQDAGDDPPLYTTFSIGMAWL